MLSFNRLYIFVLFIFVLSMNFQSLSIHGWIGENELGSNVRIYHIVSIFLFPLLMVKLKNSILKIPVIVLLFYSIIFFTSMWSLTYYDLNTLVFNYLFSLYCFVIGLYSIKIVGIENTRKVLTSLAAVMLLCVIVKDLFFIDRIIAFLKSPFGHPIILWFYGGGANLEATWITMMSVFFIKKRSFYVYLFLSLLICTLYASRTSFLLGVTIMLFKFFSSETGKIERRILLAGGFIIITSAAILINHFDINIFLLDRFLSSGEDSGSLARFDLWENILIAFGNNIYGYGAGNAIKALSDLTGRTFDNDNVHNYYGQVLLDFGFAGLFAFGAIIFTIVRAEWRARALSLEGVFLFIYFIGSLLQFRGAEAFVWLIFGFYFHKKLLNKRLTLAQTYAS